MIVGTGIDIVDIQRMGRLMERWGNKFLNRVFTEPEQLYCSGRAVPAMHFAAAFAAKEACLKALGTGMSGGIHWQDIEVGHNRQGKPDVTLRGKGGEMAIRRGIGSLHVSLSHTDQLAIAVVVAETSP